MSKKLNDKLDEYTGVCNKIEKLEEKHSSIFTSYQNLLELRSELENQLKEIARSEGAAENKTFAVKVSEVWKKWYDYEIIKHELGKSFEKVVEAGGVKAEVSKPIIDRLVKDGEIKLKPEAIQSAYRDEKQTTKVSIVKKGE